MSLRDGWKYEHAPEHVQEFARETIVPRFDAKSRAALIELNKWSGKLCGRCKGEGSTQPPNHPPIECSQCKGTGEVWSRQAEKVSKP